MLPNSDRMKRSGLVVPSYLNHAPLDMIFEQNCWEGSKNLVFVLDGVEFLD